MVVGLLFKLNEQFFIKYNYSYQGFFLIGLTFGFGFFISSTYWISNALIVYGGNTKFLLPFSIFVNHVWTHSSTVRTHLHAHLRTRARTRVVPGHTRREVYSMLRGRLVEFLRSLKRPFFFFSSEIPVVLLSPPART